MRTLYEWDDDVDSNEDQPITEDIAVEIKNSKSK